MPRSPQELYEIVSLIGELMPALPATGLFSADTLLKKHPSLTLGEEEVTWQWKDDKGNWKSYSPMDSRIVEVSFKFNVNYCFNRLSMGRAFNHLVIGSIF